MAAKISAWLFCIFFFGCAKLPEARHLLIVIHTTEARMFGPVETTWVRVERKNGKYVAGNMEIPDEQVTAFLVAVDTRSEGPLSFSDLGITQNWLDQNAEPAFDEYFEGRTSSILPPQRDLFIGRFRSASAIGKAVDAHFQSSWTDDFPIAHVEIYDRNTGRTIVLESSELHAFMIPWVITENGRNRPSFNANIGRTLGALLPEKAALKERIGGLYFRCTLSHSVYQQICPEWRKLDKNPNLRLRPPTRGCHNRDDFDPCYSPHGD
jgi:hypothetical protein